MKFTICFRKRSVSQSVWKGFEEISVTIFKLKNSSYNWNITSFFLLYSKEAFRGRWFFLQLKTLALHLWTESEICSESFRIFKIREMFEIRSEWSIEASRKTFRRDGKSEWNNRWRNPIRYLSNRPKKTHQFSYHPTQSFYFPEESSQRDKGEDRGGEERTTFPFPLSNFPKESFLSLLLFLFSFTHIYIYFSLFGDDIFTFLRLFAEHL